LPIIQILFTGVILFAFLMVLFVLAWYIALPLLLILALLGGVRWLKEQWDAYRLYRESNGCTIRRASPGRRQSDTTVIDVDYTEIK